MSDLSFPLVQGVSYQSLMWVGNIKFEARCPSPNLLIGWVRACLAGIVAATRSYYRGLPSKRRGTSSCLRTPLTIRCSVPL